MKILVVSNMGPKKSNPTLGLFVDNQVSHIKKEVAFTSYFYMKFNGDSLFHKFIKYPYFFICFFFKYVTSFKKYDIIHVHYYYPTIITALIYKYCRNRHVKVIVTCHGSDIYCYDPPNVLYRKLSSLVDHWVFTSKALQQRFYKKLENASVICAGFNDKVYQYEGKVDKIIDCLLVGSLDFNKGLDRLIALINSHSALRFAVVGSGPFHDELVALEKEVDNFVYYRALEPEKLKTVISSSHLLLSLSRNESFGLVISEAHALGVPCIATKTDGALAQIADNQFLIDQGNGMQECEVTTLMYKSIESYLSLTFKQQESIRLKLVKDAKVFSLTNVTNSIISCYRNLLRDKNV